MILVNKKVGETPLELLNRIRVEYPEFKNEKLSYAGRLDPMAEGEMLIIIGDENKQREKYLGFDKEYIATFLVGVQTDTGDALGLVTNSNTASVTQNISEEEIRIAVSKLKEVTKQKYPWFSGMVVDGLKLFDHFKSGNIDIERPTRAIQIKEATFLGSRQISKDELKSYISDSIGKVNGDFRQKGILAKWDEFLKIQTDTLNLFEVRFVVSSGTFIRALTEEFIFPVILLKLNRTKIVIDDKMV